VRWDRFFEDLEDQLSSEWEAERAALETESERLRLSRVALRERLSALTQRDHSTAPPSFELSDGSVLAAEVSGVGADWVVLEPAGRSGGILVPLAAIWTLGMTHTDILLTARPHAGMSVLSERVTFGFVLRDLVRRRTPVTVLLAGGRMLTGTIDRAGADHFDIALHDAGTPRRAESVTGHRVVPFSAVSSVRIESATRSG